MAKNMVLGLDVGSGNIKAVLAEPVGDKIFLKTGEVKLSKGLRRGVVVGMEEAVSQINATVQDIRSVAKPSLKNIYLNVGGSNIHAQVSRGIVAVARADSEIYKDDIQRAIQASEAVNLPANRMIIHTIIREYIVDGIGDISDPLGMSGARLEVESYIIDAFTPAVKNLMKCVELVGGSISGLIFNPLAAALAVLSKNQKELGVILIDIGYGTTSLAVYEEGKLIHTAVLPVGAGHITTDLAVALKIPVEAAEKIKLTFGYAVSSEVSAKDSIDLKKLDINIKGNPSRRFVCEVIESRLNEICELINNELKLIDRIGKLPGGAVIVGGGAKLPGLADLFKNDLKLSTQIGLPDASIFEAENDAMEFLESPEYATVLGLVLWDQELSPRKSKSLKGSKAITRFLKNFLP